MKHQLLELECQSRRFLLTRSQYCLLVPVAFVLKTADFVYCSAEAVHLAVVGFAALFVYANAVHTDVVAVVAAAAVDELRCSTTRWFGPFYDPF